MLRLGLEKTKQIAHAQQRLESLRLGAKIARRRDECRLHQARLKLRHPRRAAPRGHILHVGLGIEFEMRRRQARENIDQRAERADGDFLVFEIGEFLNARMRHDDVIGPLNENPGYFEW
jgi:hypothetical protein